MIYNYLVKKKINIIKPVSGNLCLWSDPHPFPDYSCNLNQFRPGGNTFPEGCNWAYGFMVRSRCYGRDCNFFFPWAHFIIIVGVPNYRLNFCSPAVRWKILYFLGNIVSILKGCKLVGRPRFLHKILWYSLRTEHV